MLAEIMFTNQNNSGNMLDKQESQLDARFMKDIARMDTDKRIEKLTSMLNERKETAARCRNLSRSRSSYMREKSRENHGNEKYNLKNIEESLSFVKDNLTTIRNDLRDFKENCWTKINTKVDKEDFEEANNFMKSKITQLERRLVNENKVIKSDIHHIQEKLRVTSENQKNLPLWPIVAFVGAYTLVHLANKVS